MALDVKEKNLIKFVLKRLVPLLAAFVGFASYMDLWGQPARLLGYCVLAVWAAKLLRLLWLQVRPFFPSLLTYETQPQSINQSINHSRHLKTCRPLHHQHINPPNPTHFGTSHTSRRAWRWRPRTPGATAPGPSSRAPPRASGRHSPTSSRPSAFVFVLVGLGFLGGGAWGGGGGGGVGS